MAEELVSIEKSENPYAARFTAFFETVYKKEIERLVASYPEKKTLKIDFKELEKFDFELADELIEQPDFLLEAAGEAIQTIDIPALEVDEFKPSIGIFNLPKDREPLIKEISSAHLNRMIAVEGVVRQITEVMPKLTMAVWECKRCGNTYRTLQEKQQLQQPSICECKHRDFKLVEEKSKFSDYQKIQIQESLEKLKGSEQATHVDIFVSDDLVNKVTAGDKTMFVGILRLMPSKYQKTVYGRFLEAIYLEETAKEFEEVEISPEEEKQIQKFSKNPKIYEMLINSVAPSIYGHESIKESIILLLFGGVKKTLPNNQTIRGNIHILLVGDPSVGKSQILQATDKIAPKSIYFAGKTASGVGITATAVKDDFGEGGWTLKAGALVLASGGVCMADELDKMECVIEDALVCMGNGELKTMKELFQDAKEFGKEEKTEKGISIRNIENHFVLSMGENLKINKKKLLAVHQYPYNGSLLEVALRSGETLRVTPNHPFFTLDSNGIKTIKAGLLKKGDFVCVPAFLPPENSGATNEKLSRLYGYLAGDGNVTYNPPENYLLRFTNKDADLLNDFSECGEHVFEKPVIHPSEVRSDGVICERINGQKFVDFIASNAPGLMEKYSEKFSPKSVYLTLADSRNYLRGLFDSEGSVDTKCRQISFSSTSERLVTEVKALLLKNGILSQVRSRPPLEKRKRGFILRITDRDSLNEFADKIGFQSSRKQALLDKIISVEKKSRTIINVVPCIGNLLKSVRTGLGLTQRQCGINSATYNNFEKETANISIKKARIVLDTFKKNLCSEKASPELLANIQLLGHLATGGIIWRKVNSIREFAQTKNNRISYAFIHKINKSLKEIKMKTIPVSSFREQIQKIRESILRQLHEIESCSQTTSWQEINQIVQKFKISQTAMAKKLNSTSPTMSRWLNQKVTPPNNAFERVSELLKGELKARIEKIGRLNTLINEIADARTYIYDLTVEGSHNFIANNIIVHNSEERSALHEAMEQGMISVAKAGIVTRFKADTSILAAANPKLGRFDQYTPFIEQVNLPPTLISRFDLFFMVKDVLDRTKDTLMADHILKIHKAGETISQYKKKGKTIEKAEAREIEKIASPEIAPQLLTKYISFARQNIFPILTKEAIEAISEFYVNLREQGKKEGGSYAATHRQLEGLVRLSEASARIRLSDEVAKEDAERAIRLLKNSLEDVVTDPETGRIDFDIITMGTTHTQITNMKTILNIIKQRAREMDAVPAQDVIDEAKSSGIEEDRAKEIMKKLEDNGEIYRPKYGLLKPTQKEK